MKTKSIILGIFVIVMMAILFSSCTGIRESTQKTNMIVLTESQVTRLGDALWTKQLRSGAVDLILTREHIERIDTIIGDEYANEILRVDTLVLKSGTPGVPKFFSENQDTLYVNFKSDSTINYPFTATSPNGEFIVSVSYDKKILCGGYVWDVISNKGLNLLYNPLTVVSRTIVMDGAKVAHPTEEW